MPKNENFALASMLATILPTGEDLGKASVREENEYSNSFHKQGGTLFLYLPCTIALIACGSSVILISVFTKNKLTENKLKFMLFED